MSDLNKNINEAVVTVLEDHKAKAGRRFSTHQEGQAYIKLEFDNAMESAKLLANCLDYLWSALKKGDVDDDYANALSDMCELGRYTSERMVRMVAMIEKLKGGVVHEPK